MISALSFDVWNTLLNTNLVFRLIAKAISEVKKLNPIDVEMQIIKVYRRAREIRLYIDDSSEVKNFPVRMRTLLANTFNIDVEDVEKIIDITFDTLDPVTVVYEDVKPTLELLKSMNMRMGIVGNTVFWESLYTRRLLQKAGLGSYFEVQVYSDEIGVFKPNRKIFYEFCRRMNVKPQDVIHVGDGIVEDVGGALSAGMKVVLIDRLGVVTNDKTPIPAIGLFITRKLSDLIQAIQILA